MINFTGGEGQKWGDPLLALVEANSHSTWPLPASRGLGFRGLGFRFRATMYDTFPVEGLGVLGFNV